MKTLILKVELDGPDINTDLDSPLLAQVQTALDAAPLEGVSKVAVSFQYSEEFID